MPREDFINSVGEVLPQLRSLSASVRFCLGNDDQWPVDARQAGFR
jgi:hypothetical protein